MIDTDQEKKSPNCVRQRKPCGVIVISGVETEEEEEEVSG